MALTPGVRLGSHEIVSLLGAGGMGEVYLALDTKLNRRVAVKVLPEAYASDPDRVSRFHREAQAVAALNHPGIASIHDFAEADGVRFLVLELIEGETLADRLKRGALPVDEALDIARQILEALEVAHEHGICHRDLKPANIKLTPDGRVKVLDFGLAKFLQTPAARGQMTHSPTISLAGTVAGVILGTAGYMSPEQAKGYEADHRSDIFSFGCILFEMLTGRQAFEGETASEILASVLKIDVDWSLLPPGLHPRIVEVLRRCLEKNPKKRWHSAADVRIELEALSDVAATGPAAPSVATVPPRPLWQRVALPVALTIAGAALAGYTAWTLKPEPARDVMRFTIPLPKGQEFTNSGRLMVALSPDGRTLAYVANRQIYVQPLSATTAQPLAGSLAPTGGVSSLVFSPDGQWIAFRWNPDNSVKKLPVTGGTPITIVPAPPSTQPAVSSLTWTGNSLLFAQPGQGILRVSDNGGAAEVLASITDDTVDQPQLLPDAKTLLFSLKKSADYWDKGQIVVQPLAGGERKTVIDGGGDGRYLDSGHLLFAVGGILYAARFDLRTLSIIGSRVPVIEGIRRASSGRALVSVAQYSTAAVGMLAYVTGPAKISEATGVQLGIFDRKAAPVALTLPLGPYSSPRVSPDGKWVALESIDDREANIYVVDLSGASAPRRLTFAGRNQRPVWSPDSEWIAFESDREGASAIFRQRADGSGVAERLTKPEKNVSQAPHTWSPNGAHLLYGVRHGTALNELWDLSVKDGSVTPMKGIASTNSVDADFSPDGRWVVYQQIDSAKNEILSYVEPYPRTGVKYLLPVESAGHPFWSRDGKSITVNDSPNQSAWVPVVTAPRLVFGLPERYSRTGRAEPNPAISRRNADAMPDGRILGVMTSFDAIDPEQSPAINIVVNWFDELRQRIPIN